MLLGSDLDGDILSFSLASEATNGSVIINGSAATYTPSQDYHGNDSFTFTASDGELSDTATVTITITAINDAPVLATIGDQASYGAGTIALSATDVDGDNLTYTVSSDEANVTASISGTTLTLTPAAAWNGTANITVIVSDGSLADSETFVFTVAVSYTHLTLPPICSV